MTVSLGEAVIEVGADTTGLKRDVSTGTTKAFDSTAASADKSGKRASKKFGGAFLGGMKGIAGPAAAIFSAAAVGSVVKSSLALAGEYQQTMNVLQAATGSSRAAMQLLDKQAMQLGRDTVFSAGEAATAMLELGKAGFKTAQITKAVPQVMNLAATEGLQLADAAGIVSSGLAQFSLKAGQAKQVVNALAGASNASRSSVASLAESMKLVGPAAAGIGLSVQETAAALAALSQGGLDGSIAGTSLASVFNHLTPSTKKAGNAMKSLGLDFTDAKGEFDSMPEIAGKLQKAFKGVDAESRKIQLMKIFGKDASVLAAVSALMKTGEQGIRGYTKAASDQGAAQKLADARMKGLKGALEQLSGSWETLQLQLGKLLSPALTSGAKLLAEGLNGVVPALQGLMGSMKGGGGGFGKALSAAFAALVKFGKALLPTLKELGAEAKAKLVPALAGMGAVFKDQLLPAFKAFLPAIQPVAKFLLKLFGSALIGTIKGFVNIFKGAFQIIAGVFNVFTALLKGDWSRLWEGLKQIFSGFVNIIKGAIQVLWNGSILAIFRRGALFLTKGIWQGLWNAMKGLATKGMGLLKGVFTKGLGLIGKLLMTGIRAYIGIWKFLFKTAWTLVKGGWNLLKSAFSGAITGIKGLISKGFNLYLSIIRRTFSAIVGAVRTGVSKVVGLIKGIPGAVSKLGGKMLDAGKGFIKKLFDGILAGAKAAGGFVSSIVESIKSAINSALRLPLTIDFDKGPVHIHATLIPAFAKGTPSFPGGLALFGEQGPELGVAPRGSRIFNANDTKRILSPSLGAPLRPTATVAAASPSPVLGGRESGDLTVVNNYYGPTTGGDRLRELTWSIRYGTGTRTAAVKGA